MILGGLDTLGFYKGDNFDNFVFAFQHTNRGLLKRDTRETLRPPRPVYNDFKEKGSTGSKYFPLRVYLLSEFSSLKIYPFPLTLTMLWASSFSLFFLKIASDTSCKFSFEETICMKCQILFFKKNNNNTSKCCLLKI